MFKKKTIHRFEINSVKNVKTIGYTTEFDMYDLTDLKFVRFHFYEKKDRNEIIEGLKQRSNSEYEISLNITYDYLHLHFLNEKYYM